MTRIAHLDLELAAPSGALAHQAGADRLRRLARAELAGAIDRAMRHAMGSDDHRHHVIQRLDHHATLEVEPATESSQRLLDRWSAHLAATIRDRCVRSSGRSDVATFASEPDYLAAFVEAVATGEAGARWYFDGLRGFSRATPIAALAAAARDRGVDPVLVLGALSRRVDLVRLLAREPATTLDRVWRDLEQTRDARAPQPGDAGPFLIVLRAILAALGVPRTAADEVGVVAALFAEPLDWRDPQALADAVLRAAQSALGGQGAHPVPAGGRAEARRALAAAVRPHGWLDGERLAQGVLEVLAGQSPATTEDPARRDRLLGDLLGALRGVRRRMPSDASVAESSLALAWYAELVIQTPGWRDDPLPLLWIDRLLAGREADAGDSASTVTAPPSSPKVSIRRLLDSLRPTAPAPARHDDLLGDLWIALEAVGRADRATRSSRRLLRLAWHAELLRRAPQWRDDVLPLRLIDDLLGEIADAGSGAATGHASAAPSREASGPRHAPIAAGSDDRRSPIDRARAGATTPSIVPDPFSPARIQITRMLRRLLADEADEVLPSDRLAPLPTRSSDPPVAAGTGAPVAGPRPPALGDAHRSAVSASPGAGRPSPSRPVAQPSACPPARTAAGGLFLLWRVLLDGHLEARLAEHGPGTLREVLFHLGLAWSGVRAAEAIADPGVRRFALLTDMSPPEPPPAQVTRSLAEELARDLPALRMARAGTAPPPDLADCLLQAWAFWLPGFARSSSEYLLRQLVRRPGAFVESGDRLAVSLAARPLDIVLRRAGYLDPLQLPAWLGGHRLLLTVEDGP